MEQQLKAGYSRRNISPPTGIYLIGYGDRRRGNCGIHDELTASALAIDDGRTQVVILACDLLAINEITLQKVEEKVNTKVVCCCSHTHSGPIVYAGHNAKRKNKRYVEYLINQLVGVIRESLINLSSVSLSWGYTSADIAVNRRERQPGGDVIIGRNPTGLVDREVGILQVNTLQGKPLATLVNYACHNVVLGPKNLFVSSDWAGEMRKRIEKETGNPCLYIQGAAGDLNPDHDWGENDFAAVKHLGNRVAESVLSALDNLRSSKCFPVKYRREDIWLPLTLEANTSTPPDIYKNKLAAIAGVPKILVDPILSKRYPWKTRIENRDGFWSVPLSLTCIRIGEIYWVGMGAEVFTEIGIQVKSMSPSNKALISSLSNGCIGYLPTKDEQLLGGYEIELAPFPYRLPGKLRFNVVESVLEKTRDIISELSS